MGRMTGKRPSLEPDDDIFSREAIRDPQHYDSVIRELAPVVYVPKYDVWATGRHAPVELMMRDWRAFSSTRPAFEKPSRGILLNDDPPEHQRARSVIHSSLSPAVMRRLRESFRHEAELLAQRLVSGPVEVDGHADIAKAYVLRVFPDALGLGEEGRENLVRFGHAQFNAFGPENELYRESMEAATEVFRWIADHCRREAVAPDGIAGTMYAAADAGDVTQEEAELLIRTLYAAGSDTTIFALGNTLRAMAEFPEQWHLLRADIDNLAPAAFDEGIRYDNPARYTRRRATASVEVDGVDVPADAKILLLHIPAGRDPRRWEDPARYDINRDVVGKHLGFGFGVHSCVGARIARLEGVSLLSALARHVASIELAGEPEVTANMAVHGHETLPLRLVPA